MRRLVIEGSWLRENGTSLLFFASVVAGLRNQWSPENEKNFPKTQAGPRVQNGGVVCDLEINWSSALPVRPTLKTHAYTDQA